MNKEIKIILMGAGTVYPLHVGAILRLAEEGYTFSEIASSSWGSLVGAALGTGYAPNTELTKFIKKTLPSKHTFIKQSYWSLYTKWGTISTKKMKKFLLAFFVNNIEDLKIPVRFIATDIETDFAYIYDINSTPGIKIAEALSASMAIPMLMEPAKINNKYYVDGAHVSNFPIHIFGKDNVLVLRAESTARATIKVNNMKDYITASVNSWVRSHSTEHIPHSIKQNTIRLRTEKPPFDLSLTDTDVDLMVEEGYIATDIWLKSRRKL